MTPMTDELMESHLAIFDGDDASVIDARISKVCSTLRPDVEQQEMCLKRARKAFTSLCQLTTSFRMAYPSDPLTSRIRDLHGFQGPGFCETLESVLDTGTVELQLDKHAPWVRREKR